MFVCTENFVSDLILVIIIIQLLNNNEPPDDINLVCQDCTKEVEGVLMFLFSITKNYGCWPLFYLFEWVLEKNKNYLARTSNSKLLLWCYIGLRWELSSGS